MPDDLDHNERRGALQVAAACGLLLIGLGGATLVHDLTKVQEWHGRCLALQEENARLREELDALEKASAAKGQEIVVRVQSRGEYAPATLAQKNRNYLNVKASRNDTWKGQIGRDRFGHAIFEAPAWSIRAGAITLLAYEDRYHITTVKGLVERFSQSNQGEYIAHICRALGVKPEQKISFREKMPELLRAMVRFECGQEIGEEHLALVAAVK